MSISNSYISQPKVSRVYLDQEYLVKAVQLQVNNHSENLSASDWTYSINGRSYIGRGSYLANIRIIIGNQPISLNPISHSDYSIKCLVLTNISTSTSDEGALLSRIYRIVRSKMEYLSSFYQTGIGDSVVGGSAITFEQSQINFGLF